MKHPIYFFITLLLTTTLFGQITDSEKEREFGGPSVKITKFNNESSTLVGGLGGWFITDNIAVGVAGYGLVSNLEVPSVAISKSSEFDFGYGGFMFYYTKPLNEYLFLSGNVLIGGGKFSFDHELEGISSEDEVFVLEPSLEFSFKTFDFLKIGIAGNYRYIYGVDVPSLSDSKMSDFSAQINFTFGSF